MTRARHGSHAIAAKPSLASERAGDNFAARCLEKFAALANKIFPVAALLLAACAAQPELTLDIHLPADQSGLAAVTQVNLAATRDGVVLAQGSFPASAATVDLTGVTHGARTVITLDGVDSSSVVIARGRTCPVDFEGAGTVAPLYFAPTNFFAPTAQNPIVTRTDAAAIALSDGTVLIAGGADASGALLGSAESFTPGAATFASLTATLDVPRRQAEAVALPSIGPLLTGGLDASGAPVAEAELYFEAQRKFLAVSGLDARVGHRVVLLTDGRALVSGGAGADGKPLATTAFVYVLSDGTYQVTAGPNLAVARRAHAATVSVGVPIVFGGYGTDGTPTATIEAIEPAASSTSTPIGVVATLATARAEATASLLDDGSILIAGGIGASGAPLASAELFNPITRTTTLHNMAQARHGHTATVLTDGRVLIAGGLDADGNPLSSVELFASDIGDFVTERSLGTARGDHAAVALCDETVLVVGSEPGAEIYSEPSD